MMTDDRNRMTFLDPTYAAELVEQISERCAQRVAPLMEAITTLLVEQRHLYERIERLEWMLGLDEDGEPLREMPTA